MTSNQHDVVAAARAYYAKHQRWGSHAEALCNEVARLRVELAKWETNCTGKHGSQAACSGVETSGVRPDSDAEVFTRAVVAGVARWEPFSGMSDQGEVCVGGLRYSTRLDVGVPVLGPALREELEKHTCWSPAAVKASDELPSQAAVIHDNGDAYK